MPYIPQERRKALQPNPFITAENEGELNFQISILFNDYMIKHGLSYGRMGDVTGAGENAVAEFRRRIMADYENKKIDENGDVYTCLRR